MSPFGKQHHWAAITDASGLRTSKTVGGVTTQYYWLGDKLQAQSTGNDYLIFLYDESGVPYGLIHKYGSTEITYYYEYNLQGDIIGIISDAGTRVVTHQYSAWGELLSTSGSMASNIGATNPLRYQGYYYDSETGFYYLQSRYYDPMTGRFINADALLSTGQGVLGYNMFAYCINDPAGRKDTQGNRGISVTLDEEGNPREDLGRVTEAGGNGGSSGSGVIINTPSNSNSGYIQTSTNSLTAESFLKSNGSNPQGVIPSFDGMPTVQTLKADTTVYRTWGGATHKLGHWVSPYDYGIEARSLLSLPPGNTMEYTSTFIIPRGTQVLVGKAAPLFGQPGGGIQWWVSEVF